MLHVFVLAIALLPAIAWAQNVYSIPFFDTQALLYSKQGKVTGCGIRFIGVSSDLSQSVDASVNLHSIDGRLTGVMKYLSYDFSMENGKPRLVNADVKSAWLRARGGDSVPPVSPTTKGEDKGSILYFVTADGAAGLLMSALERKSFLVGVTREDAKTERIFSGPLQLAEQDKSQISDCVKELVR